MRNQVHIIPFYKRLRESGSNNLFKGCASLRNCCVHASFEHFGVSWEMDTEIQRCDICNKKFANNDALGKHKRQAKGSCDACGKLFCSRSGLFKHKANVHGAGNKPMPKCDICNKGFISKETLNKHKKFYHGNFKVNCDQCGKTFRSPDALLYHRKTLYYCEHCEKSYCTKNDFEKHICG